ncbi:MAG: FHA domain-containing protein [Thermomonas sp.]
MTMKLVFPGSERAQMLLEERHYTFGSDADSDVVLRDGDIAPLHCQLAVSAQGVQLHVADGCHVTVNERPVTGLMALRSGDMVACGATRIRLVRIDAVTESGLELPAADAGAQVQATMVRPVLPKFVLRGMSGEQFGKSHPLQASMVVGRADDASLCLPMDSISRQHARLTPAGDEVLVEDLGSANGTWINGKRISRGQARHGDEIRFDTQRFQLVVPGHIAVPLANEVPRSRSRATLLIAALIASACAVALILLRQG